MFFKVMKFRHCFRLDNHQNLNPSDNLWEMIKSKYCQKQIHYLQYFTEETEQDERLIATLRVIYSHNYYGK